MGLNQFKHFITAWLGVIVGVTLLLAATLHRWQIGGPHYTKSPLIPIEFILVIVQACVILFYHPGSAIALAIKKEWGSSLIMLIAALLGFVLLIIAFLVDAPTLLYVT
ncbi:MAG: hypothetical protein K8R55_05975 [Desulfuromonadaceae bacterium]|nr:hypothetical protein [Desulfuromonadaceae bacterium]